MKWTEIEFNENSLLWSKGTNTGKMYGPIELYGPDDECCFATHVHFDCLTIEKAREFFVKCPLPAWAKIETFSYNGGLNAEVIPGEILRSYDCGCKFILEHDGETWGDYCSTHSYCKDCDDHHLPIYFNACLGCTKKA